MSTEPKTFDEMVDQATWRVMEGLVKGEPLRNLIFSVAEYSRRWQPPSTPKTKTSPGTQNGD